MKTVVQTLSWTASSAIRSPAKANVFVDDATSATSIFIKKLQEDLFSSAVQRTDEEWLNAKPYEDIPGPAKWRFPMSLLPGGKFRGSGLVELHEILRGEYGPIFKIHGVFDMQDIIFTYNVADFETVYRNEGPWPQRNALTFFDYYRKVVRPDVFHGFGSLITEQGKTWAGLRNKVNPILMKTQTVRHDLPKVDGIAKDFLVRISKIRDAETLQMPTNFGDEIRKWLFESTCAIALDKRLNLLSDNPDPEALKFTSAMITLIQLTYEFEIFPPFWKYYKTTKFKKFLSTCEQITDITTNYINQAMQKFQSKEDMKNATSVLEKLLIVDQKFAVVMAIDMLMVGIDTTASAFTTLLYYLAKNPEKQQRVRKEIMKILPRPDTPLTAENTKNMPYLRACIKESLRLKAITPANYRNTVQDLVLSGYRVPKETGVMMGVMMLSIDERYFPRSLEFFPERWLKQGEDACPAARTKHPFVYLPFGFGPRTCIGKRIAEMEIETMIARIVRNYDVSWHHPDVQYVSTLLVAPVGNMQFKFTNL